MRAVIERWVFMLVMAAGCGAEPSIELRPALFADACAALFACGCEQYAYVDEGHCRDVLAADLVGREQAARAAGLSFDPGCADAELPIVRFECRSDAEVLVAPPVCRHCATVHGDVPQGAPCLDFGDFSDCAQGLFCEPVLDVCVDPCALSVDRPCITDNRRCAEDLICDGLGAGTCAATPVVGDACVSYRCGEGLLCMADDNDGVCEVVPGLGEVCTNACLEALCSADGGGEPHCVVGPGADEPCLNFSCAAGLYCDWGAMVCRPFAGLGDGCAGTLMCAYEWACTDDVCTRGPPRVCAE